MTRPASPPHDPRRTITIDGPAEAILAELRAAFTARRFRVRRADSGGLEVVSGGFLRGTVARGLPVELVPSLRSWSFDIRAVATAVGPSTVRLDARTVMPRVTAFPFYDGIVEDALGRLRAAGYSVDASPYTSVRDARS